MSILEWNARQRLVRAITGDAGLSYVEVENYESECASLNRVVMPPMPPVSEGITEWFSKLLDECYFRLPEYRADLQYYHANCKGEGKQNLTVIYTDVLRQYTQLGRQGKLIGADEYAEDAHKARCVLTSDPAVNAWQAFDAQCRKNLGMSYTDYGMPFQLDDEARALFDQLVTELGDLYTQEERTPKQNFTIAQKACEILFKEDNQDNAEQTSSDGDDQDGEDSESGSESGEDEQASGGEGEADEEEAGTPAEAKWSERDGAVPDSHLIGENQVITGEIPEDGHLIPGKVEWRTPKAELYHDRLNSAKDMSGFHLSTKVRNLLKVLAQTRWTGGHKRGRINKRRIATIPSGNTTVFKQKHKREVLDTAVTLLVDCSGSMSGSRYSCAVAASAALADVLGGLNMPHEVLGFTYEYNEGSVGYIFSEFNEKVSREGIMERMSREDVRLVGNADADVVLAAHDRLIRQKQARKVLIILSDGQPVDGRNPQGLLRHVVGEIEQRSPVEIYSIGIESDAVNDYYTNSRTINKASELEPTLISLLKEAVIK